MPAQEFEDDAEVMATMGAQYPSSGSSTMAPSSGVSRLGMMQARLREQLMLDKESRLLQMAARREEEQEGTIKRVTKSSASTLSSSLSSLSSLNSSFGGQGRVRKLFQERRSNGYGSSPVGRDKSYPLDPVRNGGGGGGSGGGGGRPPVKPVKGVVRTRGVSVDRGKANYDPEAMRRSRSHAAFQNSVNNNNSNNNNSFNSYSSYTGGEPRSPARALRPPAGRSLQHHKSTSSLLDANQNYNGRHSSSSSGVYSRGPSRDPSPAPSPSPSNPNRFGFRGPPSRGASPAPPPVRTSPARTTPPVTTTRAPTRPQPPPRQRPSPPARQPTRQPPRQTRPVRQSSPPDDDEVDSFSNDSKSKARFDGPPITQVKSFKASSSSSSSSSTSSSSLAQPPSRPLRQARHTPAPVRPTPVRPTPAPKPAKSSTTAPRAAKPVPGLESCKICGRNFASDRIEKHEVICAKSTAKSKKRKVYDPVKMRTKGTEAEKYVAKGKHLQEKPKPKKKDWRKQHEDFIATIRAAKSGGEAPAVDTSDYVECPHCNRKFSELVAERHIPKCANISSNKAPPMRKRR